MCPYNLPLNDLVDSITEFSLRLTALSEIRTPVEPVPYSPYRSIIIWILSNVLEYRIAELRPQRAGRAAGRTDRRLGAVERLLRQAQPRPHPALYGRAHRQHVCKLVQGVLEQRVLASNLSRRALLRAKEGR